MKYIPWLNWVIWWVIYDSPLPFTHHYIMIWPNNIWFPEYTHHTWGNSWINIINQPIFPWQHRWLWVLININTHYFGNMGIVLLHHSITLIPWNNIIIVFYIYFCWVMGFFVDDLYSSYYHTKNLVRSPWFQAATGCGKNAWSDASASPGRRKMPTEWWWWVLGSDSLIGSTD